MQGFFFNIGKLTSFQICCLHFSWISGCSIRYKNAQPNVLHSVCIPAKNISVIIRASFVFVKQLNCNSRFFPLFCCTSSILRKNTLVMSDLLASLYSKDKNIKCIPYEDLFFEKLISVWILENWLPADMTSCFFFFTSLMPRWDLVRYFI